MATPQHRYQACRDRDCDALMCRAYRDGRQDGYGDGYAEGFAAGAASAGGQS